MSETEKLCTVLFLLLCAAVGLLIRDLYSANEKRHAYWEQVQKTEQEALENKQVLSGVAVMPAYNVQTWANAHPDVEIVQISTSGREHTIATVLWKRKEKK